MQIRANEREDQEIQMRIYSVCSLNDAFVAQFSTLCFALFHDQLQALWRIILDVEW